MATSALTAFLPYVSPEAKDCPTAIMKQAILKACIRFCVVSHYWREQHADIVTVGNIKDYTLTAPTGGQIETVLEPILHNNIQVWQRTRKWMNDNRYAWTTNDGQTAEFFIVDTLGTLRLYPYPTAGSQGTLSDIWMIVKPTPSATTVPAALFNEFYETIAKGALSYLMLMSNKKWSDPHTGENYRIEFEAMCSTAKNKALSGFKTEDRNRKVKGHYF